MEAYKAVFDKLRTSLVSNDLIIFIMAIITLFIFIIMLGVSILASKKIKKWEKDNNDEFAKWIYTTIRVTNTLFLSWVSLFPLFGMLGTVFGLLGLDLATGDMENIKNNFFIALTSTAWGIIFSIIYKFIYALFADFVEEKIEITKKLSEKNKEIK